MNFKSLIGERLLLVNHSRYLWILIISYSMALVSANWFDSRLLKIFWLETGAGSMIFPMTYVFADIITEVYGYKNARLAVWAGLLFNGIFLLFGQFVMALPSPDEQNNIAINQFLNANTRIIIVSAISYLLTEPLNSYIVAKLKILFAGQFIGLRFLTATLIAQAISITTFCVGAFYNTMSVTNLVYFIVGSWIFSVLIEILLLPISIRLAKKIKFIEKMDVYDRRTEFNVFKINNEYEPSDNEFLERNRKS